MGSLRKAPHRFRRTIRARWKPLSRPRAVRRSTSKSTTPFLRSARRRTVLLKPRESWQKDSRRVRRGDAVHRRDVVRGSMPAVVVGVPAFAWLWRTGLPVGRVPPRGVPPLDAGLVITCCRTFRRRFGGPGLQVDGRAPDAPHPLPTETLPGTVCPVNAQPPPTLLRPLLTPEQMARILSSRRSLTSAEAYRQMAAHLGRPVSPGRRKTSVNGQSVWVCC